MTASETETENETKRKCFHCLSNITYKYDNYDRWHRVWIKLPEGRFWTWYCHFCYNKWYYKAKPKPKPKRVLPSIIANK